MFIRETPGGRDDAVFDPEGMIGIQPQRERKARVLEVLIGMALGPHHAELGFVELQIHQRRDALNEVPARPQRMHLSRLQDTDRGGEPAAHVRLGAGRGIAQRFQEES